MKFYVGQALIIEQDLIRRDLTKRGFPNLIILKLFPIAKSASVSQATNWLRTQPERAPVSAEHGGEIAADNGG
jgi:hypothetical protein